MLLKWIVCTLSMESRGPFSAAQEQWRELAGVEGFLGQIGGWDLRAEGTACVISLWRDAHSYRDFMANQHDRIVQKNEQESTYEAISVALFDGIIDIPGSQGRILDALAQGEAVRVADCNLRVGREKHFVGIQRDSWIPCMGRAEGMVGGVFCRSQVETDRYLVVTVWQDHASHQSYVKNIFPELRATARVEDDVEALLGHLISLESSWRVLPV